MLDLLREQVIAVLQEQIEALRSAQFSDRRPATAGYNNLLRLADGRFILVNRPRDVPPNSALQFCVGRDRAIMHEPEAGHSFAWNPPEHDWTEIARQRAPWVALKLIELALQAGRNAAIVGHQW